MEIEKGLAGTQGGKGVNAGHEETQRAMAPILKFFNDRPPGVRIAATCNNIEGIPPEYIRVERWDTAPIFVDLPNEEEKSAILEYYKKHYQVEGDPGKMEGWSGAEIKSVCRLASIMKTSIDRSEKFIIPISKTMDKEIAHLRSWAKGRTIPASEVKVNGAKERRSLSI